MVLVLDRIAVLDFTTLIIRISVVHTSIRISGNYFRSVFDKLKLNFRFRLWTDVVDPILMAMDVTDRAVDRW